MARRDPPRETGDDAFAEVRAATRALNDALGSLTRSAVETSSRTSQAAVADSMHRAARSLSTAAERLGRAPVRAATARGRCASTRRRVIDAGGGVFAAKGYQGAAVSGIGSTPASG